MSRVHWLAIIFSAVCLPGCSDSQGPTGVPGDAKAVEVLSAHWAALQRGDWKLAYDQLHPELKATRNAFKQFTVVHGRRRGLKGFPRDIKIIGAEQVGDDVAVAFDVLHTSPDGGDPVAAPPRREVTMRKSGGTWGVLTNDLLAIGPWNAGLNP